MSSGRKAFQSLRHDLKRDWQMYLFLILPIIYIIIFAYFPIGGLQIAFRKYSARGGIWGSKWVGLANIRKFISSYYFETTVKNTLALSLYSIVFTFPLPIIMALLLNSIRSRHFRTIAQTITTLPHFISIVVLVGMMYQIFNARYGLYGLAYQKLFGISPVDPFSVASNFRHFFIWSGVWQSFGWNAIIYIAALAAVDPSLHEAAVVEGASRFQRVLAIDLPTILPTIITMLILRMGSVMTIGFEKTFLLQNDVNLSHSEVISTYVYKMGLGELRTDFSYATAVDLLNSVINFALVTLANTISHRVSSNGLW